MRYREEIGLGLRETLCNNKQNLRDIVLCVYSFAPNACATLRLCLMERSIMISSEPPGILLLEDSTETQCTCMRGLLGRDALLFLLVRLDCMLDRRKFE